MRRRYVPALLDPVFLVVVIVFLWSVAIPWLITFLDPLLLGAVPLALLALTIILVAARSRARVNWEKYVNKILQDEWVGEGIVRRIDPAIFRRHLSEQLNVSTWIAHEIVGSLTVTLDYLVSEPTAIVSWEFPFPNLANDASNDSAEILVDAIRSGTGLRSSKCREALSAVCTSIGGELLKVATTSNAMEVFPLGLYTALRGDTPLFTPHSLLIKTHYPAIGRRIAELV
jgi:hypothetical protein